MLKSHLKSLPPKLVDALQNEFQKIHQQFFLGRWEPSQLDGGRFAEIILRIIEYKNGGSFTSIGRRINRKVIVNSARGNGAIPESLRLQIMTIAGLILDFRNDRDVAHVGTIKVNGMDSSFVIHASNWVMAELVRLETGLKPEEAQAEIDKLIERKVPIVEDFGGRLKCSSPKLKTPEEILVLCNGKYPKRVADDELFEWVREQNKSRFKEYYLRRLDKKGLIDYHDGTVILTRRGLAFVEKNIKLEIET